MFKLKSMKLPDMFLGSRKKKETETGKAETEAKEKAKLMNQVCKNRTKSETEGFLNGQGNEEEED